jgi:hypothetical protein
MFLNYISLNSEIENEAKKIKKFLTIKKFSNFYISFHKTN